MKQSIKNRIDTLSRKMPPSWAELERLFWKVAKRPSQAELDALKADQHGLATDAQKALADAYMTKNMHRTLATFYPNWKGVPFGELDHEAA
jgi:hypothetical protein